MKKLRKFFHLERSDLGILFGLVFLLTGASFTFGVLVGFGLGPKHDEKSQHADAHGDGKDSRAPASEHSVAPVKEDVLASKKELRAEFTKSKEDALKDLVLKEDSAIREPKSIDDTKASFIGEEVNEAEANATIAAAAPKTETKITKTDEKPKPEVEPAVSSLFERKPGSVKTFEPLVGTFTIQIGSFPTKDLAQKKVRDVQESGFLDSYYSPIQSKSGETWYRVAVGSFPNAEWANKTGQKILRRKLTTDFIVRKVE